MQLDQFGNPILNQFQHNQYQPMSQFGRYSGYSQMNNGINWVQGIEGAKAYQLTPNSNTILLDSENDGVFYIKVSDNVGMCNLRVFNYTEVTDAPKVESKIDLSEYVKRDELDEILKSIKGGKTNGKQTVSTNATKQLITE